jgi:hypothetical protein
MSINLFVLPSSWKKNRAGEMGPRTRSSIQPDKGACTISASRPVHGWLLVQGPATGYVVLQMASTPSGVKLQMRSGASPLEAPRNASGTASFANMRRMDAPVRRFTFTIRPQAGKGTQRRHALDQFYDR